LSLAQGLTRFFPWKPGAVIFSQVIVLKMGKFSKQAKMT
jgi:hypothetical protein